MENGETILEPAVFKNQVERFLNPNKVHTQSAIESQFKNLQPGQHLCLLYENASDLFTHILPFIRSGLGCNHKCLYVTDSFSEDQVVNTFYESGFDVKSYCSTGQFTVLDAAKVYNPDGCFEPDRTIDLLVKETDKAIEEGYSALRITSDASWIFQEANSLDRLVGYESKINSIFFEEYPCIAACQYDLRKFNPKTTKEIIKTHPYIIYGGEVLPNCYYIPNYGVSGSSGGLNEIQRWLIHLKKHREKQLEIEKSENLYRTVFETTGTAMCIVDREGMFVLVNKYWTEKLGYSKEEIEGKFHFSRVIHKDDLNRVQDYFQARFISPQVVPDEYEARIIDRFGNARNVIVYVRMLPGSANRTVSVLDITAQKIAEEEIKAFGARYHALFENVPVAISENDYSNIREKLDGIRKQGVKNLREYFERNPAELIECNDLTIRIGVNRALKEIWEAKTDNELFLSLQESFQNQDLSSKAHSDTLISLAEGQTSFSKEEEVITARGNRKTIRTNVLVAPGCEETLSRVYITFVDVSALKESEDRYRALVELGGEVGECVLMIQDVDGQEGIIIFTSEQLSRLTKYSRTELLGKSFFELLSTTDRNKALSRHRRKMRGESLPGLYEMTIIRKDGKEIPVEITSAITQYHSKLANVIYLRDITERKLSERRLMETKARASALQKSEHVMREFQAVVSHELRTPLAAIKGFASTLLQPDVKWNEEEKADFIKEIDSEVDRLSNIVSDLLDISSMESGRLNENVSENTIAHVLEGIRLGLEAIAEHHVLTINIEADLPSVMMDPEQIAQVFYNLVGNATKFSPEGSQISIQVKKSSGYIVTSVADHGIGMSREEQNKIFDRLYQAKRITYGAKKGTGLGLSICRGIIEKHGGRIWLESQQGKGSTFYFSLPLSKK